MVEEEVVRDSWEKWDDVDVDRGSIPRPKFAPSVDEPVVWMDEDEDGFLMFDRNRDTVGSAQTTVGRGGGQ